ncbi:MAG: hypothetical protein O7B99_16265 [Planctomycetota bacterium]|nr:hypothetical protein [Planctomycetota bacterium]
MTPLMKSAAAVAFLLAIVLGAVSAGVMTSLLMSRHDEARLAAVVPEARPESEMLARIRELRDANHELRERLAALELRPAPAMRHPVGDFASREDFEAFREEVREWMAERNVAVPGAPELKDQVADALSSIRRQEALGMAQAMNEAKLEVRILSWSMWLDLDDYQANEMRAILTGKDELDRELLRMRAEGADDEVLAQIKESRDQEFHAAVERVLTP